MPCGSNVWCYRIIGAALIVAGLYLVLYGKNEERKFAKEQVAITSTPEHSSIIRPSSHAKTSLAQPLLPSSTENVWSRKSSLHQAGAPFSLRGKGEKKEKKMMPVIHYYYFMSGSLCVYEGFSSFLYFYFYFFG